MAVTWRRNGRTVGLTRFQRGQTGLAEVLAARAATRPQAIRRNRPLVSLGLGVGRDQVAEFNQLYKEAGITGAHHKANGDCVLESRGDRNKVLKLRGVRDNDAGYGDFAGRH